MASQLCDVQPAPRQHRDGDAYAKPAVPLHDGLLFLGRTGIESDSGSYAGTVRAGNVLPASTGLAPCRNPPDGRPAPLLSRYASCHGTCNENAEVMSSGRHVTASPKNAASFLRSLSERQRYERCSRTRKPLEWMTVFGYTSIAVCTPATLTWRCQ